MTDLMQVVELICQPMKEKFKPTKRIVAGKVSFSIDKLSKQVNTEQRLFGENHIQEFFDNIDEHVGGEGSVIGFLEPILPLVKNNSLDNISRAILDQREYAKLFEVLAGTTASDRIPLLSDQSEPQLSAKIDGIYGTLFADRLMQRIFEDSIQPNAQHGHEYFATLDHSPNKVERNFEKILNASVQDEKWSPESLRQFRKKALQTVFSFIMHYDANDEQDQCFKRLDRALRSERTAQTDTEWGSLHHVIYGMATGLDDNCVPLWFNQKSYFSYVFVGKRGLEILIETYEAAMRSKLHNV